MTREEIAKIIKESRVAAGLTQIQVADALGRPQNTISAWEMGRAQPDANTLFELFRVLGRSVDEAFGFTVESFNVTARERTHIEKYRALDAYGQDMVSTVLDLEHKRCVEQTYTAAPPPEPDPVPTQALAQELAELKRQNQEIMRQNQEMAAEIAAINEEDAAWEAAHRVSHAPETPPEGK